jgi:hypothetical protein
MDQKPKARSPKKKNGDKSKDKTQAERFVETARELGVDEIGREFERAITRIAPPRQPRK